MVTLTTYEDAFYIRLAPLKRCASVFHSCARFTASTISTTAHSCQASFGCGVDRIIVSVTAAKTFIGAAARWVQARR